MKYAIVDGVRSEATTGLRGSCQACGLPMTAKCGPRRIHHWAHRTANCDRWWERETSWHRDWKDRFPQEWQEVRLVGPDGELHIADVQTVEGTVMEFQHSPISVAERRSREAFYGSLVWVVDGTRNAADVKKFAEFLSAKILDYGKYRGWRLPLRRFKIIDDWITSKYPVYMDFGDNHSPELGLPSVELVWRIWKAPSFRIVVTPYSKRSIVDHYSTGRELEGFERHLDAFFRPKDYRSLD